MKDLYIYDVNLSTGTLLYSCAGGVGVTKEPYMVDMHKFIRSANCAQVLEQAFRDRFGTCFLRRRFMVLKEEFNQRDVKLRSLADCADLYLLWMGGGFTQRYRDRGYDALYHPSSADLELIRGASRLSREKNLLFRKEDFHSMSESIINENVVVYCHFPAEFGDYGPGFKWSEGVMRRYVRILTEFHRFGYKVCVSALHERRGSVFRSYRKLFPDFDHLVVPGFKVSELTFESQSSEIYLFNF